MVSAPCHTNIAQFLGFGSSLILTIMACASESGRDAYRVAARMTMPADLARR
jgi:hypothetical protein